MHDDPRNDASDPSELTQRHAVPPVDPAVSSAPVEPSGAAVEPSPTPAEPEPAAEAWTPTPTSTQAGGDRYTPAPEARADWARSWDQVTPVTPERWYEPAPTPAPTAPATAARREGRVGGSLVAAALLSAILASGGTVVALNAVGALDRPAAAVDLAGRHQRRGRPAGRHR